MSDKDFTKEELELVEEEIGYSNAYDMQRMIKRCKFAVGDIVIKQIPDYEADWKDDNPVWVNATISHVNDAPQRYKVVFVDEFDIPWFKKVSAANGKLCDGVTSLLSFGPSSVNFIADPEYANSILVGEEEYDPGKFAKDTRKKNKDMRKRNAAKKTSFADLSEAEDFIKGLKAGDILWEGTDNDFFTDKKEVEEIKVKVVKVIKPRDTAKYLKEKVPYIEDEIISKFGHKVNYVVEYVSKDYNGHWNTASEFMCCLNMTVKNTPHYGGRMSFYKDEPEYAKKF